MTMLHQESVLNAILFEFSDLQKNQQQDLLNSIMHSIKAFGLLKWLNHIENLELNFKKPVYHNLISFNSQSMDTDQYIDRVLSKSPNARMDNMDELKQKMTLLEAKNPNLYQLTNGHDLMKALAKYFREECNKKSIKDEELARSIRMLFNNAHFSNTNIFDEISNWEHTNQVAIINRIHS